MEHRGMPCDDSGFDIEGILYKGILRVSPVTGSVSLDDQGIVKIPIKPSTWVNHSDVA